MLVAPSAFRFERMNVLHGEQGANQSRKAERAKLRDVRRKTTALALECSHALKVRGSGSPNVALSLSSAVSCESSESVKRS